MPSSARMRRRREIDRGLRQPRSDGAAPEAHLEVAQPPADLGPPVRDRGQRQDRVVERLREPVAASVPVDEAAIGRRIAVLQPGREGRADVPGDPGVIAEFRVGSIAVGRDPRVPIPRRGRRRVRGHQAGGGVDPEGLIEVPVDDESGSGHASAMWSRVTVTAFEYPHVPTRAGFEAQRPREEHPAALVHALEARSRSSRSSRLGPTRRRPGPRSRSSISMPM